MFLCGFRGPGTSLHVASLLQGKHKPSIADHNLASVETLQNALSEWKNGSLSATSTATAAYFQITELFSFPLCCHMHENHQPLWKDHVCLVFADPHLCFPNMLSKFNFLYQFRFFQVQMRQYVINWQIIHHILANSLCMNVFNLQIKTS